ncbi:thiamine pyrophosphate-dependent dehydrogenase E1 component subunit alpha [Natrarchaeobius chitinivorans]|uniref:Thiamine pyrophosphate-dependent dehydrogenase E1 component subunit alpha n=1 Tax=Natrarchaeobius chitinivorans TaxID=1679083 RepID=A0A3N6ME18_NATCH|nr:thiamine pyrophosphate-dependent dehydrogenase E1 component subunit alpha [Natrarchaeobius chitinivorans]RQG94870.1 thiamine pyrophosphate-dependent dehydrogenase E1 component subunit alpha [Natrarchaeobius chitinivorans]
MIDSPLETEDGRVAALESMVKLRRFEERTSNLFADGEIPGFVHLYIGQEAVAVGATSTLDSNDHITSTHRGHGHCVAMGLDPSRMFAELMAKDDGFCRGKGGSMHIADVNAGMLGANGVVGSGAPIATGAGVTKKLAGDDSVALAFYGEGAVSEGQVHEAITLGAAWDLPVIYLVEKNNYAEGMPAERIFRNTDFEDFGDAYGIPAETVDGMDVVDVYEAVSDAKQRALEGEGPSIVVAETFRYNPHSEGLDMPLPEEELEYWKDRDAIETFKDELIEQGELTAEQFEEIEDRIEAELDEAVERARNGEPPEPEQAYEDVFTEPAPDIEYHRANLGRDQL